MNGCGDGIKSKKIMKSCPLGDGAKPKAEKKVEIFSIARGSSWFDWKVISSPIATKF